MELGQRLKAKRKEQKISAEYIAKELGVSVSTVYRYEDSSIVKIPVSTFEKMSKDNNQELKVSPLSNVKRACSGKNGWGEMTVAMPNDVITNFLINPDYYIGGLVICKRDEFEKYKEMYER